MFIIVEPHQHTQYEKIIEELCWNAFKRYWVLEADIDKRKAIYFIALDAEKNYIGGAWLIKRSSRKFLKETGLASPHLRNCQYIWELGGINTCMTISYDETDFARAFYQAMYQQLLAYSEEQYIEYAIVHTSAAERRNLQSFGKWPVVGYIINPREYTMAYSYLALRAVRAKAIDFYTV
jgi:hypothetical protein